MKTVVLLAVSLSLYFISFNKSQAQWKVQTRDSLYNFHDVCFVNVYTGWVTGDNGKIFKTTNGGYNWFQQIANSPVNNLQRICFPQPISGGVNSTVGYIIGYVDNSNPHAAVLLETTDGGYIWQNVLLRNNYYWKDVQFFNNFTGFFVGGRDSTSNLGYVLKTTTGGIGAQLTYTVDAALQYGIFKSLSFLNTNTGYISATDSNKNSKIIKTMNSGGDFFDICSLPNVDIHDMQFINEQTGFAVGGGYNGAGAKILKTTNSGYNWTIQTFPMDGNYFNGLTFVFARGRWRGWACGENGIVYNTTNYGNTWYKQKTPFVSPNMPNLNGISFLDLDHGWASGNSGSVITTYTGGDSVTAINVISSNIPESFKLSQNYPNPFNPSTKIRFSVPSNSLVRITVFNSLGQIVKELVNSQLHAGEYETDFNAESLSSGIYYYTLTSGSFIKTNKMLLIK